MWRGGVVALREDELSDRLLPRGGLVLLILSLKQWSPFFVFGPEIGDGVEGCLLWGKC